MAIAQNYEAHTGINSQCPFFIEARVFKERSSGQYESSIFAVYAINKRMAFKVFWYCYRRLHRKPAHIMKRIQIRLSWPVSEELLEDSFYQPSEMFMRNQNDNTNPKLYS